MFDKLRKVLLCSVVLVIMVASIAYAMTHFLVAQWYENGDQMCKYDNGTVLNVGYKICPLSIED